MGAQSFRANRWHGRAHAEASRFIGSSTDDRTIGPPSDYYRLAAQLRVIPLFDGSIESVHIDMDDFADGHLATILFLVSTTGWAAKVSANLGNVLGQFSTAIDDRDDRDPRCCTRAQLDARL